MAANEDAKGSVSTPHNVKTGISMTRRLVVLMILVAVVPLLVIVGFATTVTSNRLRRQTAETVSGVGAGTIERVTQTVVENIHLVQSLASNGAVSQRVATENLAYDGQEVSPVELLRAKDEEWRGLFTYDPAVVKRISDERQQNPVGAEIHRFSALFPQHVELVVADRHGGLLAATNRTQTFYFGEEPWWRTAMAGEVFLGPPTEDVDTGVISMVLAVPVRADDGDVIGALSSSLDIREVVDTLRGVELGETGVVRVYDPSGVAIFDPTRERLGTAPLPPGIDLTTAIEGSHRGPSLEGHPAIHGWARARRTAGIPAVDRLGWTAVASQEAQEALQAVNQSISVQVLVAIVVAVAAVALAFFFTRRLTRQLNLVSRLFEEIHRENYTARAEVVSDDELGRMTAQLNSMLDQTLALIQSQEERDSIQRAVVKLLEEVSEVAQGDLTVRAEVTPDVTGAIADSFNYMIAELQRIIGAVQDTTVQVNSSADAIRVQMERLASGTDSQSRQIRRTSEQIGSMATTIREVSQQAGECSTVADRALHSARQGTEAVEQTIVGMHNIRAQVREGSKRLKRLGESSQEIGQIVKIISEISDRTNILALNASLQAAAAGEAGESFAIVADEIERLAERSTEAAQRIETLIKTVQVETAETVAAMEGTTREVVEGSQLANRAGQALEEIEAVAGELNELVRRIAREANQQAHASDLLAGTMGNIAEIIHEAAEDTQKATTSAHDLTGLADVLRDSVRRFRLPAKVA